MRRRSFRELRPRLNRAAEGDGLPAGGPSSRREKTQSKKRVCVCTCAPGTSRTAVGFSARDPERVEGEPSRPAAQGAQREGTPLTVSRPSSCLPLGDPVGDPAAGKGFRDEGLHHAQAAVGGRPGGTLSGTGCEGGSRPPARQGGAGPPGPPAGRTGTRPSSSLPARCPLRESRSQRVCPLRQGRG